MVRLVSVGKHGGVSVEVLHPQDLPPQLTSFCKIKINGARVISRKSNIVAFRGRPSLEPLDEPGNFISIAARESEVMIVGDPYLRVLAIDEGERIVVNTDRLLACLDFETVELQNDEITVVECVGPDIVVLACSSPVVASLKLEGDTAHVQTGSILCWWGNIHMETVSGFLKLSGQGHVILSITKKPDTTEKAVTSRKVSPWI
ncbi:AIM24 family protein [Methanopyrus sp. SNP6]|uniref:AIM24 family protein n=1 Tax=Methanopyrus sp. SNP6 TaxID=1937005 RepID=UPI0011E5A8C1|nr:AIM24 family protein [Methanopyrus sp. SNP6]